MAKGKTSRDGLSGNGSGAFVNQDLYYLLKWETLEERTQKFAAFQADPEWISARAETEKNGPIVASITNTILQPTSFSSVK